MVQTITPVVHGGRRGWVGSVAAHTVGATASAAALGAVLGGIGALAGAPWGRPGLIVVAAIAATYAVRELARVPIPLPNLRRQVPEWWRTFFPPAVASLLYGLGLGVGFLTYLSFGSLVAVGAVALISGRPLEGLAMVAPFGLARGLSVLVAFPTLTEQEGAPVIDRLDALAASRWPRVVNGLVLCAVALTAALGASGSPARNTSGAAAWLLAAVFAWAGFAKVLHPTAWRASLDGFLVPVGARAAAVAVPVAELSVAALVASGFVSAASWLALLLLVAFAVATVRARALRGPRLACRCFGGRRTLDYRLMLARDGALAALALASLLARSSGEGLRGLDVPRGAEVLAAALAAGGLVLVGLVSRTIRITWRSRP